MSGQAPIKVDAQTKERIRYLAALIDTTQADIVDRAVKEFAARRVEEIERGIDRARSVLAAGDAAIAAQLLGAAPEAVERVAGGRSTRSAASPRDISEDRA